MNYPPILPKVPHMVHGGDYNPDQWIAMKDVIWNEDMRLAKLAGIDPADCVAVGDGDNDVAMLKAAGLGIAMGSGSVAAKAAADRIGPDAEPHGIAELCRALWPEAF